MLVTEHRTYKFNLAVSWGLLFLTAAGIGFFLIVSPKQIDEYWFACSFKDWLGKHGIRDIECGWKLLEIGWPIKELIDTWIYHIKIDCGRISNLAMMFFLFLPKWVGSSVAWGVWFVGMYYSLRLAQVNLSRSPWLVAVAVFCWSFQINWSNNLGCLAFQYNYLVPSGLLILYIWWLKPNHINAGIGRLLLIFGTGIIIGALHEGFTVPVIAGGCALVSLYPEFRTRDMFVALSSFAISLIFLILCPGFSGRAGNQVGVLNVPIIIYIHICISHIVFLMIAVWYIVRCIKRRTLKLSPLLAFAFISGGVSFLLQLFAGGYRRIGWWSDIISIIALLDLLRTTNFNHHQRFKILKSIIVVILGGLSLAHWSLVDYFACKTKKAFEEEKKVLQNGEVDQIFLDFVPNLNLPMLCMWTPNDALIVSDGGVEFITRYYFKDNYIPALCIIPTTLRHVDSSTGAELPGGSGVRMIDGIMFCEADKIEKPDGWRYGKAMADMKMSTGLGGECMLLAYPFRSEKDNNEYYYLRLNEDNMKVLIGDLVYLTNIRSL